MNGYTLKLLTGIGLLLLTGTLWCDQAASQSMSNYAGTPPFVTTAVTPNILLLLDNSGSMNNMAYPTATVAFNNATKYSGIFDGTECYQYASNRFQPDPAANPAGPPAACNATYPWSGNLLNYGVNREIDVVKLVMVGG